MSGGVGTGRQVWGRIFLFLAAFAVSAGLGPAAAESVRGLKMPPARYNHPPAIKPIVLYTNLKIANQRCRGSGPKAARAAFGMMFYGCAIRIIRGEHRGRHMIFVATDAPVPANVILRHEYGHVNGWRH